jgi:hypothetical protein
VAFDGLDGYARFLRQLTRMAEEFGVAVVLSNQVRSNAARTDTCELGIDSALVVSPAPLPSHFKSHVCVRLRWWPTRTA